MGVGVAAGVGVLAGVPPRCARPSGADASRAERAKVAIRIMAYSLTRGAGQKSPAAVLRLTYCLVLGGYLSMDFLTIVSSLPSILAASLLSSAAMPRQTSDLVVGSRRSITSVPSVYGTRTTRVPQPRQPAG